MTGTETAGDREGDTERDREMVRQRQTPEEAFWWTEIHGEIQDGDSKRQMKNQKLKLRRGRGDKESLGKADRGSLGGEQRPGE